MACPCEVQIVGGSRSAAAGLLEAIAGEALRIENKFSRYIEGNVVDRINRSGGQPIRVDEETAGLLDYAAELHELSNGQFDITSGVLRRAWSFNGGSQVPSRKQLRALLRLVGWDKLSWKGPELRLPKNMEIDFGGIGKEYAVDRALRIGASRQANILVNFGGDLAVHGAGVDGDGWSVGIEGSSQPGVSAVCIRIKSGALATSGNAYRYVLHEGKRLGHILDPLTGWPVPDAPKSVTVVAPTCTQAGAWSTLAILQGADAETFLQSEGLRYWCQR